MLVSYAIRVLTRYLKTIQFKYVCPVFVQPGDLDKMTEQIILRHFLFLFIYTKEASSLGLLVNFLWMLLERHPLCHRMCKVTKESSGANKIMRNAIDFTLITLRWTSGSSRQSIFSTTSDGSQRLPNGGKSRRRVYLVKIGPKALRDRSQNPC